MSEPNKNQNSDYPELHQALANKQFARVIQACQSHLQPTAQLYYLAGVAAYHQRQYTQSLDFLKRALQNNPHLKEASFQSVLSHLKMGQSQAALKCLQVYQESHPSSAQDKLNALDTFLKRYLIPEFNQQGFKDSQVFTAFLEGLSVELDFQDWQLYLNLGLLYRGSSQTEKAIAAFEKAFALSQNPWILLLASTLLPQVYQSEVEIQAWRQRLTTNIARLQRLMPTLQHQFAQAQGQLFPAILPNHFYLAYQGLNDKVINQQIMALYRQIWQIQPATLPPRRHPKIRLGFVSSYLCNHSVTHSFFPLVQAACQDQAFEVYAIASYLSKADDWTQRYQDLCHRFITIQQDIQAAAQCIADLELNILIFMDIGMQPQSDLLALFRLAPTQCVLAGHPVTTGSPQIDYFVSSDVLEPPGAQNHYTETLYLTRGAPPTTYTQGHQIQLNTPLSREELSLPTSGNLYYCPMSLFKIHPRFDQALKGILEGDKQAQIYFSTSARHHLHQQLMQRFQRTLGTESQRIHFLPFLPQERFCHLLNQVDVVLDSFPFNGGNTSFISLLLGQPIVSLRGDTMRGRGTLACYAMMGLEDLTVGSIAEYIELALKLGQDLDYRAALRAQIRKHNHRLLDNYQGIDALLSQCKTWAQSTRHQDNSSSA